MNLQELHQRGGFVSAAPVKKEVRWDHVDEKTGEKVTDVFDVLILKLSYGLIEQIYSSPDKKSRNASLISEAVRLGEDGKEVISYVNAYQLAPSLGSAFYLAIAEVNALPKPKKEEEADDPKG
jgi:hypothetical protein